MTIYQMGAEVDDYPWLSIEGSILEFSKKFCKEPMKDNWVPVSLERIDDKSCNDIEIGNMSEFDSGIPVFDTKSKDVLEDILKNNVEFLRAINDEKELWFINVLTVLDCIDYEKSEYKRFSSSERIMYFTKYAFEKAKIGNNKIFKLKDEPGSYPFVTEDVKKAVEDNNLKGFIFSKVWEG